MSRFSFLTLDAAAAGTKQLFRESFEAVGELAEGLIAGRAKDNAFNHLEEALMWVGKAIRDDQIAREKAAAAKAQEATTGELPAAAQP